MKPASMAMLKMLVGKTKVPVAKPNPVPSQAPIPSIPLAKPVNDPTDPNQLLEGERTPTGNKPAKRIPVVMALPRNPIKTKG